MKYHRIDIQSKVFDGATGYSYTIQAIKKFCQQYQNGGKQPFFTWFAIYYPSTINSG
jgi:hypothetical protein